MPLPQEGERLDQLVGDLGRPSRNPGGDEKALTPSPPQRAQEDPYQLFGLEQGARELPVSPHGTVVTVEAAGVSHEYAEQLGPAAGPGTQVPYVQGTQRSGLRGVPKAGRGRTAVPVVGREGHQDSKLL